MNSPKRQSSVNLGAGDLKYNDFNGDGIIDGSDQHRIGKNSMPRGQYGFSADLNYKGWFMNMLWQGATPADLYMGGMIQEAKAAAVILLLSMTSRPTYGLRIIREPAIHV